jgi:hypothetical protein
LVSPENFPAEGRRNDRVVGFLAAVHGSAVVGWILDPQSTCGMKLRNMSLRAHAWAAASFTDIALRTELNVSVAVR